MPCPLRPPPSSPASGRCAQSRTSTPARPGRIYEVFTGKELTTIPVGTAEDVAAAFAKARAAQVAWAARPARERAAIMERFRSLVIEHRDFLMDVGAGRDQ